MPNVPHMWLDVSAGETRVALLIDKLERFTDTLDPELRYLDLRKLFQLHERSEGRILIYQDQKGSFQVRISGHMKIHTQWSGEMSEVPSMLAQYAEEWGVQGILKHEGALIFLVDPIQTIRAQTKS